MKRQPIRRCLLFASIFSSTSILLSQTISTSERMHFFEKRIRPVLVTHCYECHGPDEDSGKLRLDSKAGWQRGGESGPAIVPGNPSSSLLYRAISYQDKKLKMPPPDTEQKLSGQQIRDFSDWIRDGAVDPRVGKTVSTLIETSAKTHWAFQPIQMPVVDASSHPIDFLIKKNLSANGYVATQPADNRTLIRRATYDLLGLPPTPEQLSHSSDSFPRLVDQLLDSPRYGERWGRHWLDVARYSDAKDGVLMYGDARIRPFAYTYRDYVIRAFNEDKPFDQFIREQIAADRLHLSKTSPDLAAMGLLTLGRMFDRNPHDVIDDQIDVITRGFLGLTVSCARCHDHKFDPVPTADYYSLYGVFASSIEPLERPRIEPISESGKAFEKEFDAKLKQVLQLRAKHYEETLRTARNRTADYLVQVATTKPDISETTIFFLSLLPDQLRPQFTFQWRRLIADRAHSNDPIFGPWYDMMLEPKLQIESWRKQGVDSRIIDALAKTKPQTPEQIARTYGETIRSVGNQEFDLKRQIEQLESELVGLTNPTINIADIVAGGNGTGTGKKGAGIHPATGMATTGEEGFVTIDRPDQWIAVPGNIFVDGVFVPRGKSSTISSTGIQITGLQPTSGRTWDYVKSGPSAGFTVNSIDGIDLHQAPHSMLAMHANKGITFDLSQLRAAFEFRTATFKTLFGHGGAKNESQLDFFVYLDGQLESAVRNFKAQQKGAAIEVAIPKAARFLTLVVTEGALGISHDQAILGNPVIVLDQTREISEAKRDRIVAIDRQLKELRTEIHNLSLDDDPIAQLLLSKKSPVWIPISQVYYLLSRKDKDAFRGAVNELDAISVKHKNAAARAMVMVDSDSTYQPVIFQRGDPTLRGNPVPRQFLEILAAKPRAPFTDGSGRLGLANAIASTHNPLTARVWVNRVWMHHFGSPLVENPSDFGLQTKRPVQHELLDFLASKLIEFGWRTKPLHKLIMTSKAYQRSSRIDDTAQMIRQWKLDPSNQFFWHANRRRLDLEQMRDTMLVLSNKMDDTMYGRPLLITDAANHRRTVYAFVERQNIPNVVQTFDFANADTSTAKRVTTTVPQQALFAMNSRFIAKTAKAIAERLPEADAVQRMQTLYHIVWGRSPTDEEHQIGIQFVASNGWQQYVHVLLMTNEFWFVD